MIARLEGRLAEKRPERLTLDVGGVGYEVRVPLSTFLELPDEGKTLRLRIHTYLRQDQLLLYGFGTEAERTAFELLLQTSGVGPRLALAILSGLSVAALANAIRRDEFRSLLQIPGVGRKTAERICIDLRDKVDALAIDSPSPVEVDDAESAISALENLGYPRARAERAVQAAREAAPEDAGIETLIREALRVASG
ncbi:MAG: Holliday junction branch migration protein RuvA [Myxococcota bacterium]